ncbi:hypothetical protein P7K49_023047 [Saguinus oedipus]|uniref:Uncharacterized protein n=1 Tax=Saguinus oedipus TaxID=9490 RepID=A0ABQ9UL67_SAGOE|nr:hypothetical protein P7K49_023047 [Saguinus oedipus]
MGECPLQASASNTAPFLTAEPPAVVTGSFLVGPVSDSSTLPCLLPPALFNQEPASGQTHLEETYQMSSEVPQASQPPSPSGPTVHGLPTSPDRPGSTSPFAPSATDLPSMPEPALTSRANVTGEDPWGL